MARTCIFCGEKPVTLTHIYNKTWIEKLMPGTEPYFHEDTASDAPRRWWEKHEMDFAVKRTCNDCNSGWMNEIDQRAEEWTTPMAAGYPVRLSTLTAQRAVATWATLVAILVDARRNRLVQPEQCKWFKEHRQPLSASVIWLGRTDPPIFAGGARVQVWGLGKAEGPNAYLATMNVNHFVAQVYVPVTAPDSIGFNRQVTGRFVRQLWPNDSFASISWPPAAVIPYDGLDAFATSFASQGFDFRPVTREQ